jgi:hypothetical protein
MPRRAIGSEQAIGRCRPARVLVIAATFVLVPEWTFTTTRRGRP